MTIYTTFAAAADRFVDRTLAYLDRLDHKLLLCRNCRRPHWDHSKFGDYCPVEWPKPFTYQRFQILMCQASLGEKQCPKVPIPGKEYCSGHIGESI